MLRKIFNLQDRTLPNITWPLRLAVIDIGENTLYLCLSEHDSPDHTKISFEKMTRLHISSMSDHLDYFSQEILRLLDISKILKAQAIQGIIPYASQLALAKYPKLCEQLSQKTGLNIEKTTPQQENYLRYLALKNRIDLGETNWLAVHLGRKKVAISVINSQRIVAQKFFSLGAAQLWKEYTENRKYFDLNKIREFIRVELRRQTWPFAKELINNSCVILTGGNSKNLITFSGLTRDKHAAVQMSIGELDELCNKLCALSHKERQNILGPEYDHADIILPAAFFYDFYAKHYRATSVIIPNIGVKEGALHNFFDQFKEQM